MSETKTPRSGAAVLIASASGRAFAAAARRAGYAPLVADFFDDSDTRDLCAANCRAGDPDTGFDAQSLIAALDQLAEGREPIGLAYGTGFEDRTDLLDEVASRWPLIGNPADVVRRVKDPRLLDELCRSLRVPHPEISFTPPPDAAGWLVKSVGGAGGSHVAPADAWRAGGRKHLFPARRAGRTGLDPLPLRWNGGAGARLQPAMGVADAAGAFPLRRLRPPRRSARAHGGAADGKPPNTLAAAAGLVGLNSFDFLVAGEAFVLIEINPRPGATLDIFEDRDGLLFQAHVDACRGISPSAPLEFTGAAATQIVYARREIGALPAFDWPEWTADRPSPGGALRLYDPLCTIKACAADPADARARVAERTACLLDSIDNYGERDIERDGAEHQYADGTSR